MRADLDFLASAYPDLGLLSPVKRLLHWYRFGQGEGRFANEDECHRRLVELGIEQFDSAEYLSANPDLDAMSFSAERALVHFLSVGVFEGRSVQAIDGPGFCEDNRDNYEDRWCITREMLGIQETDLYILGRFQKSSDLGAHIDRLFASSEFETIWHVWPELSNEDFLLAAYSLVAQRCPDSNEFSAQLTLLDFHQITRMRLLRNLFETVEPLSINSSKNSLLESIQTSLPLYGRDIVAEGFPSEDLRPKEQSVNQSFTLLGSRKLVDKRQWRSGLGHKDTRLAADREISLRHLGLLDQEIMIEDDAVEPLCSVLVSVYNGESYLDQFLTALVSQSIFSRCEVIVIEANSSDSSRDIINNRLRDFPNVKIIELDSQINVYEAWNMGVRNSSAPFVTNWNVDDMRHSKSLEAQVQWLRKWPMVDVCYQDVWLSYEKNLSFSEITEQGLVDVMPPVSTRNLLTSNFVHNGPMWRRSLHDRFGYFEESLSSAADWEFWLRCCAGGAKFHKSPWPTVSYYVNPVGVSTRPGTEGIRDSNIIRLAYQSLLFYPNPPEWHVAMTPIGSFPNRRARLGMSLVQGLRKKHQNQLLGLS